MNTEARVTDEELDAAIKQITRGARTIARRFALALELAEETEEETGYLTGKGVARVVRFVCQEIAEWEGVSTARVERSMRRGLRSPVAWS